MASNGDDHDVAVVHDVGAKLRLNRANGTVNISEDTQSIFSWVKPFWEKRDPIWVNRGTLNRHPILLS
jgi:hypothetical protein